jgi:transglutaminase-like putative cysteine protease
MWAAALLALSAWRLSTAWAGTAPALVLVAAAVLPLLILAVGARLRAPSAVLALVLLLGCLAGGYPVVVPAGTSPATALRDVVARLVTEERPVPATAPLLVPGILLVVLVALWVGMRTVAGVQRGAGLVAAPAGAVALYLAAALLTAGAADPHGLVGVGIAVIAAIGWFALQSSGPSSGPSSGTSSGTSSGPWAGPWAGPVVRFVPAVLLAVIAALAVGNLSTGGGFDPRTAVTPPRRVLTEPSPLPRIAAWQQHGDDELLRTDLSGPARLRLVVLTEFTGETWSATGTYGRLGTPPEDPLPAVETTVTARVSVTGLDGPWLPTPGRPVTVSLSDVDMDPDTGSLALRTGEAGPGLAYSVQATVDSPRVDDVAVAPVPAGAQVHRLTEVPGLPRDFVDYARQITFGASTPFEQAVALEHAVRTGRQVDPTAPAGSSYARLETFLFGQSRTDLGAQAGTSEQFATAFAVLARSVGLPTRVVVGFGAGTPGPAGTRIVRGRDVEAWPEVYFGGLGWYAFSPTPSPGGVADADAQVKLKVLDRVGAQASAAPPAPVSSGGPPAPTPTSAGSAAAPSRARSLPVGQVSMAVAVFLFIVVALLLGARAGRRLRHRRAGDRGAWAEVLDVLVLLRRPPPRWHTAPQIADDLAAFAPARRGSGHPVHTIAHAADRALFAPPGPRSGGTWRAVRDLRRTVRAAVPLRRRLMWPLDPRPLLRRR